MFKTEDAIIDLAVWTVDKNHEVIMDACLALSDEGRDACEEIIRRQYPFDPQSEAEARDKGKAIARGEEGRGQRLLG